MCVISLFLDSLDDSSIIFIVSDLIGSRSNSIFGCMFWNLRTNIIRKSKTAKFNILILFDITSNIINGSIYIYLVISI